MQGTHTFHYARDHFVAFLFLSASGQRTQIGSEGALGFWWARALTVFAPSALTRPPACIQHTDIHHPG